MHIQYLEVVNFRAIRACKLEDLKELVVIAGQNGSGKSCLLDAIRLAKSVYGGYQPNEYSQWFGEFQINLNDPASLQKLLNDKNKEMRIEFGLTLREEEKKYLMSEGMALVQQTVWRTIAPEVYDWTSMDVKPLAAQY